MQTLRAIVIGAGWAGEGHTAALRHAGVDVVALCARDPENTAAVAERLGIGQVSTDWQATLEAERPDIVALATPASLRRPVVEAASARGCHIYCDKPLAATAAGAADLFRAVEAAGVRHAYAATHRYDPSVAWLAELVRDGTIGTLREILWTSRFNFPPLLPWSWALSLEAGGGALNNALTHFLGMLERILDGPLVRATGEARLLADKAPVVPGIHDFRHWIGKAQELTPDAAEGLEWRACDADGAFSACSASVRPGAARCRSR
jgi:predicted dehydrogenase